MSSNKKKQPSAQDEFVVIELSKRLKSQLEKTAGKKKRSLNEECYRRLLCSIERELTLKEAKARAQIAKKYGEINWVDMIFNPDRAVDKKKRRKK